MKIIIFLIILFLSLAFIFLFSRVRKYLFKAFLSLTLSFNTGITRFFLKFWPGKEREIIGQILDLKDQASYRPIFLMVSNKIKTKISRIASVFVVPDLSWVEWLDFCSVSFSAVIFEVPLEKPIITVDFFELEKLEVPVSLLFSTELSMDVPDNYMIGYEKKAVGKDQVAEEFDCFLARVIDTYLSSVCTEESQNLSLEFDRLFSSRDKVLGLLNSYDFLSISIYDFDPLRQKERFLEDLFFKYMPGKAKDRIPKRTHFFFWTLVITCLAVVSFVSYQTFKDLNNIQTAVESAESAVKSQDFSKLGSFSTNVFSRLSRFFFQSEIEGLEKIKGVFLLHNEALLKFDLVFSDQIFKLSPTETFAFSQLKQKISTLVEALHHIKKMSEPEIYTKYEDLAREAIVKVCNAFCKVFFSRHEFMILISTVENYLDQLASSQSVSLDTLIGLKDTILLLQTQIKTSINDWWIKPNLNEYKALFDLTKSLNLGDQLKKIFETATAQHRELVLNSEHYLFGPFFIINNGNLSLTKKFEEFCSLISLVSHEPLFHLGYSSESLVQPSKNQVCLWDEDCLKEIVNKIEERQKFIEQVSSYGQGVRFVMQRALDAIIYKYLISTLRSAQVLLPRSVSVEEKAKNLIASYGSIQKIRTFLRSQLQKPVSTLDSLWNGTVNSIIQDIKAMLEHSIITSYVRLDQWNRENLIQFLFQCQPEEVHLVFAKFKTRVTSIVNEVIMPLLDKISVEQQDYNFLLYLRNQVTQENNQLDAYTSFVLSLKDWTNNWKDKKRISNVSPEDFFLFHLKNFERDLIDRTNFLRNKECVEAKEKLVDFFNRKLAGKFPFGLTGEVQVSDLILFLQTYDQYKKLLKENASFLENNREFMEKLDLIDRTFFQKGNKLFYKVKIAYHVNVKGKKNDYLVIEYRTQYGETVSVEDQIEIEQEVTNLFKLQISIANSSVMKVSGKLRQAFTVEFFSNFSIFALIQRFYSEEDSGIILKFVIPIENEKDPSMKDQVIVFARVLGIEFLPTSI